MQTEERKLKKELHLPDVVLFLKDLAAELAGESRGPESELAGMLDNVARLELKLKEKGARYSLKLKVEQRGADPDGKPRQDVGSQSAADGMEPVESYKKLKKRMKASFRKIGDALADNRLPTEADLAAFRADSVRMVAWPGYGDVLYNDYIRACDRLEKAYAVKDFNGFAGAYRDVEALKGSCHKQYK